MSKAERTLTKSELKRKEKFDATALGYTEQGYEKSSLTCSVLAANLWGFALPLPFVILLFGLFNAINEKKHLLLKFDLASCLIFVLCSFALIVVHEGIHGIMWAIFAKKHMRSVSFGFIPELLTPYCTCNEALTKAQYIIGAMLPTIILGVIPAIAAIVIGNQAVFLMALFMIFGGGGDLLITIRLLFYKKKSKACIYLDHPYDVGLVVFEHV